MSLKQAVKKILPGSFLGLYHRFLSWLAAWWYGYPSEELVVIGITGTKGKSTTTNITAQLFEMAGCKVGFTSTATMKIAGKEWLTDLGMTMPGRFYLQKLLRQMVDAGCTHAIVETSSEGIAQHRHRGVHYDTVVLTNLMPEHIEAHGSFEAYRAAKGELFAHLKRTPVKHINGKSVPKRVVLNPMIEHYQFFAAFQAGKEWQFSVSEQSGFSEQSVVLAVSTLDDTGATVALGNKQFHFPFLFAFNVENLARAFTIGIAHGISVEDLIRFTPALKQVPGRQEFVDEGQSFKVMVDYTYEPNSFRALYKQLSVVPHERVIQIVGGTGGGRDAWRRPVLGEIAATNADIVIVTTDDPYDDDPDALANDVMAGAQEVLQKRSELQLFKILDRREAIKKAISLAKSNDLVLVTGRGAEQKMAVKNGKYIPFDDRAVTRELLHNLREAKDPQS